MVLVHNEMFFPPLLEVDLGVQYFLPIPIQAILQNGKISIHSKSCGSKELSLVELSTYLDQDVKMMRYVTVQRTVSVSGDNRRILGKPIIVLAQQAQPTHN